LSFVRILQRCPQYLPKMFDPWLQDPQKSLILTHDRGVRPSAGLAKIYRNQQEHDPSDINRAREIASLDDPIPVGILYQNPDVPCYEDLRNAGQLRTADYIKAGLEAEFDKFTIWPDGHDAPAV
jgi:2-oxoglutarate ferredoxin oxidoreductase subunit beta